MAYGHELFLGFCGKQKIMEVASALNLEIEWHRDGADITGEDCLEQINEALEKVWFDAITDMGLEILPVATGNSYHIVRTPAGNRKMTVWYLTLHYDAIECDDEPQDAVLGVSLISRYFPTFLDWGYEYGGSGMVISLDRQMLANIGVARSHIEKVLPPFTEADIQVKELFY